MHASKDMKDQMGKAKSINGFIKNNKRLRYDIDGAEVKKVYRFGFPCYILFLE